jgi:hypothetical protein
MRLWSKTRLGIEGDDRSCVWRRCPLQRSLVDRIEGDRKLDQRLTFRQLLFSGLSGSAYGPLRSPNGLWLRGLNGLLEGHKETTTLHGT